MKKIDNGVVSPKCVPKYNLGTREREAAERDNTVSTPPAGSTNLGTREREAAERDNTVSTPPAGSTALSRVHYRLHAARRQARPPEIASFREFLLQHARVKVGPRYVPYHFGARPALEPIVAQIDHILAHNLADSTLALCGGAQFGKTVLMLNLLAYLVAVKFRNVGYYLPDDDLVAGLVDGKLRPDVLDQIPWLAHLIAVGKTLNATGRAVHRKGAFLCTDGERTALAWLRGLGKIPTAFSMDVIVQDEKDDLPEAHAKFLSGRMTASDLRFSLIIGTQRYHGAGQNLAFEEGTQHIGLLDCPGCGAEHNPETAWPEICRLVLEDQPPVAWPKLTREGAPRTGSKDSTPFAPNQNYTLCCPHCATPLPREKLRWHALAPERAAQRRWSYRLSQLLFPEIDLAQIVAHWQLAVRDPAQMTVFCTDRLALPKSTTQALTPHHLHAARAEYPLTLTPDFSRPGKITAGLDLGDQCWFVARQTFAQQGHEPEHVRLLWIEAISAERVRTRVPELCRQLRVALLCVDAGPLRDLSRDLAFALNDLENNVQPHPAESALHDGTHTLRFSRAGKPLPLRWHGPAQRWENLRCACVEFTQREGQGLRHKIGRTQDGRLYPLLAAHREETIARVIGELVPPDDSHPHLMELADGTTRLVLTPRFRLPRAAEDMRPALDLYERHLLTGSRQENAPGGKMLRFLDRVENHFLLATAYAALAELLLPDHPIQADPLPAFHRIPHLRSARPARRLTL